jgi:methylamine dehydrogenase accessory protein MauD
VTAFLLTLSLVLLVAVVVLFLLVLALAREVGRLQVRLGPLGARMMDAGPTIGQPAPAFEHVTDQAGRPVTIGGAGRERAQLLLFVAPACPTCKTLVPGLRALARTEPDLDVVLVSDGEPAEHEAFLAATGLGNDLPYVVAREVGVAYQAGTTPYGVVLDRAGTVRAKGLCNHLQQVESLLEAHATGFASLQHLSAGAHRASVAD